MTEINKISLSRKKYEIKDPDTVKKLQMDLKEYEVQLSSVKSDFHLYLKKAMTELFLGYAEKAIESAKQFLLIRDTCHLGWFILGCAYFDNNDFSNAKKAYENALANNPADANSPEDIRILNDIFENLKLIELLESQERKL